jgi:hypothetical protein
MLYRVGVSANIESNGANADGSDEFPHVPINFVVLLGVMKPQWSEVCIQASEIIGTANGHTVEAPFIYLAKTESLVKRRIWIRGIVQSWRWIACDGYKGGPGEQ